MDKNKPKLTIITVSYNSQDTIRDTIESVASQTYKNIEYIIVDGNSTDFTLSIVDEYSGLVTKTICESDNGIYDAMNKGIESSSGDIIGILNSDDVYNNKEVLSQVVEGFEESQSDIIYGDLDFVDKDDLYRTCRQWKSSPYVNGSFTKGWHPPHPTFFVKKKVYEKCGFFDESLKVSADFELMLRLLEVYKIPSHYLPLTIVRMRLGGESGKSLKNIIIGNLAVLKAFKKNQVSISLLYPIYRLLPKIVNLLYYKMKVSKS